MSETTTTQTTVEAFLAKIIGQARESRKPIRIFGNDGKSVHTCPFCAGELSAFDAAVCPHCDEDLLGGCGC